MTTPNGPILFNSSTGNDITASGLGAANVYGSGASTTGSSAVVTGIDTTGVSSGDLLWVQSSSGRQFSIIFTVDSSTQVTCDDVFANTESGRTWAIGGKRATLNDASSALIVTQDAKSDWDLATETDQSVSQQFNVCNGFAGLRGISTGALPIITQTSNNTLFYNGVGQLLRFSSLEFQYSHSTKNTYAILLGGGAVACSNIIANDASNNWYTFAARTCCDTASIYMEGSIVGNCVHNGIAANQGFLNLSGCVIHDCGENGAYSATGMVVTNSIFHGNTRSGLYFVGNNNGLVSGNIFSSNGRYGIEHVLYVSFNYPSVMRNSFYSNTLGSASLSGLESVTDELLSSDPFVDTASYDFNLSDVSAGSVLRDLRLLGDNATSVYPFRQYVSDDFDSGAGGGGATVHPLYAN